MFRHGHRGDGAVGLVLFPALEEPRIAVAIGVRADLVELFRKFLIGDVLPGRLDEADELGLLGAEREMRSFQDVLQCLPERDPRSRHRCPFAEALAGGDHDQPLMDLGDIVFGRVQLPEGEVVAEARDPPDDFGQDGSLAGRHAGRQKA